MDSISGESICSKTPRTAYDVSISNMVINAVGVVRSDFKDPMPSAGDAEDDLQERRRKIRERHRLIKNNVSELRVFPEMADVLDGIEDYSHLLVLYWAHLIPAERRRLLRVHPMGRGDIAEKGIFATCSPTRPNPILVSAVKLLSREGNVLRVVGLEAVDGSPLVDIKPYVLHYHGVSNPTVPPWARKMREEMEETEK